MVRLAGLEPATLGLEGRCSIQLSYKRMVGVTRFEHATSCSQSRRSTRLSYTPSFVLHLEEPLGEPSRRGILAFPIALVNVCCGRSLDIKSTCHDVVYFVPFLIKPFRQFLKLFKSRNDEVLVSYSTCIYIDI